MTQSASAQTFHALHQNGLLILPNAWDAGSARIIENAGAKAIATSSAAVAWAHGYPDGEALTPEMLLDKVVLNQVHTMTQAFLANGSSEPFTPGELNNPTLNQLMRRD